MSLIDISTTGAVRTVTLNRPEKHNALSPDMMNAVRDAFTLEPPADERVTVLRGHGKSFCSGLELSMQGVSNQEAVRIEEMFDAIQRYPLPVVAVVQGKAIAGGCELALHCDFIVAARDAAFVMPLAQLGVSTTWFLTKKIIEAAGAHLGREFLLLGEPISGERLHHLGIACRTSDAASLDATAQTIIDRLAANAPLSLKSMKAQLVEMNDYYFNADFKKRDDIALAIYESEDSVEGISARLAKRQPVFKGR
ncbi:MAG: enoyl-CoA hydratase/isomerase family protein [Hyphomicrobiaceae bacterium]